MCSWTFATGAKKPTEWQPVVPVRDGTSQLRRSGSVALKVLTGWNKQKPTSWGLGGDTIEDELFWVGLRIAPMTGQSLRLDLDHILFNSVSATNALTIPQPELLGVSDGAPFQSFELVNRPLYQRAGEIDPYNHLKVEVRERQTSDTFGLWTAWERAEHFALSERPAYRLDR